jgi:hypothetical protein
MHGLRLWVVEVDGSLLVLMLVDVTQMRAQLHEDKFRVWSKYYLTNSFILKTN